MALSARINLEDNFTAVMVQASKQTKIFQKDVQNTKKSLDSAFKREHNIKMRNSSAMKAIDDVMKKTKGIHDKVVKITAHTQLFMERTAKVRSAARTLALAPITLTIKAKDLASPILSKVGSLAGTIGKVGMGIGGAGALAVGGVSGMALKGAAGLERQQISMEHFIGVNNKGMTQDQVKAGSDKFLADLRKNADVTPFETGDVISAGTRAIGISAGKTDQAMSLLKLAEDMTALTPGKQLSDAIEALADLKTGETERMKEFGFKISQADIKKSGGKMENITNAEGLKLGDIFKGGSDKLSKSAEGMWSTVTGTMKSGITDMGKKSLDIIKPELEKIGNWLSTGGASKLFDAGSNAMAGMFNSIVSGIKTSKKYVEDHFLENPDFKNLETNKEKIVFILKDLTGTFNGWWEADGKTLLQTTIDDVGAVLKDGFMIVKDPMKNIAKDIGTSIGEGLKAGMKEIIDNDPMLAAFIGGIIGAQVAGPAGAVVGAGSVLLQSATNNAQKVINKSGAMDITKNIADTVTSIRPSNETLESILTFGASNGSSSGLPKKAIGMSTVPRDNYPLMAHQGERLLTANEASQQDRGSGSSPIVINVNNPVVREENDIQKIISLLRREVESTSFNMAR